MEKIYYYKIAILFFFLLGLCFGVIAGIITQQIIIGNQISKIFSNLKVEKIDLNLNETYMMDRMDTLIKEEMNNGRK